MEKTYSILIQFGDGKPVASKIRAKDGVDAQDKALAAHPGARSIRITGVLEVHLPKMRPLPKPKPRAAVHQLFTDVDDSVVSSYIKESPQETKLQICHQLRKEGLTYKAIARQLDIGETTVRTWIKNTMPS
jgi:DNA invertase Pin-like site-specific DNA recombinase